MRQTQNVARGYEFPLGDHQPKDAFHPAHKIEKSTSMFSSQQKDSDEKKDRKRTGRGNERGALNTMRGGGGVPAGRRRGIPESNRRQPVKGGVSGRKEYVVQLEEITNTRNQPWFGSDGAHLDVVLLAEFLKTSDEALCPGMQHVVVRSQPFRLGE